MNSLYQKHFLNSEKLLIEQTTKFVRFLIIIYLDFLNITKKIIFVGFKDKLHFLVHKIHKREFKKYLYFKIHLFVDQKSL